MFKKISACVVLPLVILSSCDLIPKEDNSGNPDIESATQTQSDTSTQSETDTQSETETETELALITAQEASTMMGTGFNLGQMFDNNQHSPTLDEAKHKIDAYYAQGYRNVRIPVSWSINIDGSKLIDDNGNINTSHARFQELVKVIDYSLSLNGMYVVINAHHEYDIKDNNQHERLAQLWDDAANYFSDRDHRLIFELLNEPHLSDSSAMDPATLRFMTKASFDKVRAVDHARIIIIGGNQWFSAGEMAKVWPNLDDVGNGEDQYLMATFHHYNPWNYHGEGDLTFNWNDTHITDPINTMKSWANSVGQGMPVYIGEWGTNWEENIPVMDCNNIRAWYEKFDASYARVEGMPTALWDDGGWFKVFDHATDNFDNNLYQCIISGTCEYSQSDSSRFNAACGS